MPQPADYPLDLYRGDSGHWQFKLWGANGAPFDLTGATAKSQIRDRPEGTRVVNLVCSITLPNIIDVVLLPLDSKLLLVKGAWDLQLTFASGDVLTPVAGAVTVAPDVTDSTPDPPPGPGP